VRSEAQKNVKGTPAAAVAAILNAFQPIPSKSRLDVDIAKVVETFLAQMTELVKANAPAGQFLEACDNLRDGDLPACGVALEDRAGKPSRWRLDEPELLLEEAKARKMPKANAGEDPKKIESRINMNQKAMDKLIQARTPMIDLFKTGEYESKYKEFDAEGMPTKDAEGNEVAKGALKKLEKAKAAHEKVVATFLKEGGEEKIRSLAESIEKDKLAL